MIHLETANAKHLREWAIANTSVVTLYLWEFQRTGKKFPFPRSLINKGEHQNFKKKHLLNHLETSSKSLYLWEFQRLGRKVTFAKNLINKGKHQNFKKKHFLKHLKTGEAKVRSYWHSKGMTEGNTATKLRERSTAITTWLREWAIANTSSLFFYLWEFQRLSKMFPFTENLINKMK